MRYNSRPISIFVVYLVYEEIAFVVLLWARIKWTALEDCEPTTMFGVLFGVMYISFFIIGRAVIHFVLVVVILSMIL